MKDDSYKSCQTGFLNLPFALIGTHKQSVSDVEQIFSSRVLEFFERKGYTIEAEYVKMIRDWRRVM